MLDPLPSSAQNILIDDFPVHRINRTALRQRLIAVSQDAVFLPNGSSFRANLDLYNASSAEGSMAVIQDVGLRSVVEERGGIEVAMRSSELS